MKSTAKLAGHPAQPILIVFPLGPLATSIIFDGMNLVKDKPGIAIMSYWMITIGLIAGLMITIPAWIDWLTIPTYTRAKRASLLYGVGNVLVSILLGASWWWRTNEPGYQPATLALISSGLAFILISLIGWLDSELIDHLWVDANEDTHSNVAGFLSDLSFNRFKDIENDIVFK